MTHDRAANDADRDRRAEPMQPRHEEQKRGNQLDHAGANPAPGLKAHFGKDVDRFRRGSEFEEEGLEKDDGGRDAADPADDVFNFGVRSS